MPSRLLSVALAVTAVAAIAMMAMRLPQPSYTASSEVHVVYIAPAGQVSSEDIIALSMALKEVNWFLAREIYGFSYTPGYVDVSTPGQAWSMMTQGAPGVLEFGEFHIIVYDYEKRHQIMGDPVAWVHEMLSRQGLPTTGYDGDGPRIIAFMRGAGGLAGAQVWGTQRLAIVGDVALDALRGLECSEPSWECAHDVQVGALAHEVLHILYGPKHDNDEGAQLSYEWWLWPNTHLTSSQKEVIAAWVK